MSLRFITGRSGSGKTTFIEREMAAELERDPMGAPVIVIVPDQMSFSMEHSLSVNFGLKGIIRAQVLTFKRLAWRVLQETGGITRKEIEASVTGCLYEAFWKTIGTSSSCSGKRRVNVDSRNKLGIY